MNFKHWPYWLKVGFACAAVTFAFFVLFLVVALIDEEGFFSSFIIMFSPMMPFAILFDAVNPFFEYKLPFLILPIMSVVGWFIFGSLYGIFHSLIKKLTIK